MPLEVGDRVEVERERATVAYVGAVEGFVGTWVGLDWDDPHRGKHDGTVKGRRYFQTRWARSEFVIFEMELAFLVYVCVFCCLEVLAVAYGRMNIPCGRIS